MSNSSSNRTPMPAPTELLTLIDRFSDNYDRYHRADYNETQLRIDFLNPLLELLGWDVANRQGLTEDDRDVIHEFRVKVEGEKNPKAPDYCVKVRSAPKFFVEAKKPHENIEKNHDHAFQLRRYAWSAKLPLSILTDFEEIAVYDCRVRPNQLDKPTTARTMYINYKKLPEEWDKFAGIFSKQAVVEGSFDRYAVTAKKKRGTDTVDDAFLADIEQWRDWLASNIAKRNKTLTVSELNDAVQRTIDRIIFLRIVEDRDIEDYGRLAAAAKSKDVYGMLVDLYREADARYNSGLFHFSNEKGQADAPDTLTPNLSIDNKVLKEIIGGLYYPQSPYVFSVLPASILGQVYEQFLGKVITLDSKHAVDVELKPEVRKAGGVYYTPTYIAEYIVGNTVGQLVEGKTPDEIATMRFLDPACGSGSFLLVAYDYLLDWHLRYYRDNNPQKLAKGKNVPIYPAPPIAADPNVKPTVSWRLTTAEKKRILINNICGVDIDRQAVEVTKLSLLLRMLEGENSQTLSPQKKLHAERVLPNLANNIKCGNSLISSNFYDDPANAALDFETQRRINAFDWDYQFREVMKQGGFDAVIGNPPYGGVLADWDKTYIRQCYRSYQYKYDTYIYFIERALSICRVGGRVGFITPEIWLKLASAEPLRQLIHHQSSLLEVYARGENVFEGVVVNTVTFILERGSKQAATRIHSDDTTWVLHRDEWTRTPGLAIDYRVSPVVRHIVDKVRADGSFLENFGDAVQGITPYDKYRGHDPELIKSRAYHCDKPVDKSCGKWLAGKDLNRYSVQWSGEWLRYGPWLAAPREPRFFEGRRILFREVPGPGKRIQAAVVEETFYHGHSITPFKPHDNSPLDPRYIVGIANSKLMSWYGSLTLPNFGKDIFPKLNPQDIKALPIRHVDFKEHSHRTSHDKIVALVNQLTSMLQQQAATKSPHDRTFLETRIEQTDRQIDRLVYELYGLSDEEIAIVEGVAV